MEYLNEDNIVSTDGGSGRKEWGWAQFAVLNGVHLERGKTQWNISLRITL